MTITGNQKEASVLRDDVSELSLSIILKYQEKLKHLSCLEKLNSENKSFLISNEIEKLLDNLSEETHITEVINVIDFSLSELITGLMKKFNRKFTDFDEVLASYNNSTFNKITNLRKQITSVLSDLRKTKDEIILALDAEMCKISKDEEEIKRIRYIYQTFPEIMEL
ncbi:MAG: hypothetical protein JW982_02860 [Spirochaetes bacterium]|nr:hypothetical protein [Spirochaetota bacterium]